MKKLYSVIFFMLITIGMKAQTQISVGNQVSTFTSMIRGYHFTAPTNFTICGIEVPTTASNGMPSPNYLVLQISQTV
jgi:hypothetical protein